MIFNVIYHHDFMLLTWKPRCGFRWSWSPISPALLKAWHCQCPCRNLQQNHENHDTSWYYDVAYHDIMILIYHHDFMLLTWKPRCGFRWSWSPTSPAECLTLPVPMQNHEYHDTSWYHDVASWFWFAWKSRCGFENRSHVSDLNFVSPFKRRGWVENPLQPKSFVVDWMSCSNRMSIRYNSSVIPFQCIALRVVLNMFCGFGRVIRPAKTESRLPNLRMSCSNRMSIRYNSCVNPFQRIALRAVLNMFCGFGRGIRPA